MDSILLSTDFTYSCVPGDQGGPIFLDLIFFWQSFYVQIGVLQFVSHVRFYAVDEDNTCALTVRKGHAITFTNQAGPIIQVKQCTVCLHTL
jgi:hypothetical protein